MPGGRPVQSSFKYAYLENTNDNHNKFYEMIEELYHTTFTARYGPIGKAGTKVSYSMSEWYDKYDEKIKKGYVDSNKTNPKPPFEVNQIHLDKVNQVMALLTFHVNEIEDGAELLRDVGMVRSMLKDPKAQVKVKGELEADDMKYLNDVWKKIKHYATK